MMAHHQGVISYSWYTLAYAQLTKGGQASFKARLIRILTQSRTTLELHRHKNLYNILQIMLSNPCYSPLLDTS